MNANAQKLVAALRSGEHKQGRGQLTKGDLDCCLGVACKVYQKEVGGLDISIDPYDKDVGYNDKSLDLPRVVQQWFGFKTPHGKFISEDMTTSLVDMNDSGKTFEEIAAVIESEPEGLFA